MTIAAVSQVLLITVVCTGALIVEGILGKWAEISSHHFLAFVCVPGSALFSLMLVTVLHSTAGSRQSIEVKMPGFEFKGPSGAIIMWVICFLAAVGAFKLLWSAADEPVKEKVTKQQEAETGK
jgi:hypothetical protein